MQTFSPNFHLLIEAGVDYPKNWNQFIDCFDKTRTPIKSWFAAIWYLTNQKSGVSALGIQRLLGLGSYQTAWTTLHRLRYAMVNPERDKLSGIVEIDETYVGGVVHKKVSPNQTDKSKAVVLVAIELLEPKGFGRVRLRQVDAATKKNIEDFICDVVEPSSQITYRWFTSLQFNN
tara:strand:+ start:33749 stop:34273 length:525 start_codon:yes stop_codon:yes gene_type:complete